MEFGPRLAGVAPASRLPSVRRHATRPSFLVPHTMSPPVLVVFSHLRWSFVYRRPQHLMSRLAGRWHIVFIEEPVRCDGPAFLEVHDIAPQLQVLVPHTPIDAPGFHDDQLAALQTLLDAHFLIEHLRVDVAWLYTPMALPLVKVARPACVVYDCMAELTAFTVMFWPV